MSGSDNSPLLSAAEKITTGERVDWNEVQSQIATPDQAAVVEELRSLEQYAQSSGQAPATWGRFHIVSELGRGTFGTVYCAIDPTLQLEVALKVVNRSRVPGIPVDTERALDEARRLVKVKHPNVVRAYGAELIGDEVGLSMEIVKGQTLDEIVRRQAPFSANEATIIGLDLCRALAAVHGSGILHGDVKAHNVMREKGGRTVLMDFGTGRDLKRAPSAQGQDFAGTPLYLAPEAITHPDAVHARSDLYSFGCVGYFLLTGRPVFEGETVIEVVGSHLHKQPVPPDQRTESPVPASLSALILSGLEKEPERSGRHALFRLRYPYVALPITNREVESPLPRLEPETVPLSRRVVEAHQELRRAAPDRHRPDRRPLRRVHREVIHRTAIV